MTAPAPRVLILGREPAVLAEVVASLLVLANLFFLPDLNPTLQGFINAFLLAAASVYIAVKVRSENLLAILIGAFKTAIALAVAFGWSIPIETQAAVLVFLSLAAGLFVRQQALAPVAIDGSTVPVQGRHAAV